MNSGMCLRSILKGAGLSSSLFIMSGDRIFEERDQSLRLMDTFYCEDFLSFFALIRTSHQIFHMQRQELKI